MPAVMSCDPFQQRVDDARETAARPDVPVGSAAVQWDEDAHGLFSFRRTSSWPGRRSVPPVANGDVTTSAPEKPGARKEDVYTSPQVATPFWPPVVRLQRLVGPSRRFAVLQQWEGTVLKVVDTEFSATLRDLTTPTRPDEQATFDVEEVSEDDRTLLAPGAVFYWALGYETSNTGQVSRVSRIRLRRLPRWTKRDMARLEERAKQLEALFGSSR